MEELTVMNLVAVARRDSVERDVIDALDRAEAVYRHVQDLPRNHVAMTEGQVAVLSNHLGEAYQALSKARYVIADAKLEDDEA